MPEPTNASSDPPRRSWVPFYMRQNIYLFVALLFAVYLSTAAIASIPTLTEDTQSANVDLGSFKGEIDRRELITEGADVFNLNPFAKLDELLANPPNNVNDAMREAVENLRDEESARRTELQRLFDNHLAFWAAELGHARSTAVASFAENVDRKGNTERRQHYSAMLEWFNTSQVEAQRETNECIRASDMVNRNAIAWSDFQLRRLQRRPGNGLSARAPEIRWEVPAKECQEQYDLFKAAPARPELGKRLGPFTQISLWLLQTESISLVLIAGLFGFGLLGAAASTIIRERAHVHEPGTPLVRDLPSVVIRGLTAAIVVFLAVKGGLAVFGTGSPDPNPYVLLLTCLIAAVFSEPVWVGSQHYLEGLMTSWSGGKVQPGAATNTVKA